MRPLGILVAALAITAARAGDPAGLPADGIAAAKRDYAALRAAPADSGEKPPVPVGGPEDPGPGAPPGSPAPPPADPSQAPGRSVNWLVDAMEGEPGRAPDLFAGDELIRAELEQLGTGAPLGRGGEGPGSDPGGKGVSRVAPDSVTNPLDAFMGGWISARDRSLLLPERRTFPLLGSVELGTRGGPSDASPRDAPNPYVADLGGTAAAPAPPSELPLFGPLPVPGLPGGNSLPGPSPGFFDSPRLEVPDFAQPGDDDKYFKQMRRF